MGKDREGQLGLPLGGLQTNVEFVHDLTRGRKFLRRRKVTTKPAPESEWKTVPAKREWWIEKGRAPFFFGAELWHSSQFADISSFAGHNVERESASMSRDSAEESLREAFRKARSAGIGVLDLTMKLRSEALSLRATQATTDWIIGYLHWTVDLAADEYRVSREIRSALKKAISEVKIPGF